MSKADPTEGLGVASTSPVAKLAEMLLRRRHYIERIHKINGLYQRSKSPVLYNTIKGYVQLNYKLEKEIERLRPGTLIEDDKRFALRAHASAKAPVFASELGTEGAPKGGPEFEAALVTLDTDPTTVANRFTRLTGYALSAEDRRERNIKELLRRLFEQDLNTAMFRGAPGNSDRAIEILEKSLRNNGFEPGSVDDDLPDEVEIALWEASQGHGKKAGGKRNKTKRRRRN
jgi:hypothetical protein